MFRRLLRNSQGATAIEFAIVAPVLFLIIFGTLEFAIIMHISSVVEHAVHEGARFGITGNDYKDRSSGQDMDRTAFIKYSIEQRIGHWLYEPEMLTINTRVLNSIQGINLDGTIGDNNGYGNGDQTVIYKVTYRWQIMTPFLREALGSDEDGTFTITSVVAAKNEGFCGRASCFGT